MKRASTQKTHYSVTPCHDNKFCEYWNMNYCSATEHRNSKKHQQRVQEADFQEFDEVASLLYQKNFAFSEPPSDVA